MVASIPASCAMAGPVPASTTAQIISRYRIAGLRLALIPELGGTWAGSRRRSQTSSPASALSISATVSSTP